MQISDNVSAAAGHKTTTATTTSYEELNIKGFSCKPAPRISPHLSPPISHLICDQQKILMKAIVAKPRTKLCCMHATPTMPAAAASLVGWLAASLAIFGITRFIV